MKVVHFATYDFGGGAVKASSTLHHALCAQGVDHRMLVLRKYSNDPTVFGRWGSHLFGLLCMRIRREIDSNLLRRYYQPWELWSLGVAGNTSIVSNPMVKKADIISLSWVSGFLGVKAIARLLDCGKPVIWTLYDMWSFTGGCHYSDNCTKYKESCSECSQLDMTYISNWVWKRKRKHWNLDRLTIVCPSQWLAECVSSSSLFGSADIRVIPTGIDLKLYHPSNKQEARSVLALPQDKKLILFAANRGLGNKRKGGPILEQSLLKFAEMPCNALPDLVVLGGGTISEEIRAKFKVHYYKVHTDEQLACLYNACDVLVAPSKEDNLPLTVLEAMACGTPCAAFRIGGMPDVIRHRHNGYLASPFDINDLAKGMAWILGDEGVASNLGENALNTIQNGFTSEQEAEQYLALYQRRLADVGTLRND